MSIIGFVGTGLMGRGMARSLLRNGHTLKIYNRTRAKAEEVAQAGGVVVDTPKEAADGAEFVITMLADPEAVTACFEGDTGILSSLVQGAIVIDSSTISPQTTTCIAEQVKGKGAQLLDAPVFGSKNEAENGALGFLVGGEREAFDAAQEILTCLGKPSYMGASGMGVCAKLVINLVIGGALEAFNEGMVMATRAGLDPDLMYSVLMNSRARCGIFEMKAPSVLKRDFTTFFPLKLMDKDLRLVLETADSLGLSMPAIQAVKGVYGKCVSAGLGDEDFSATIKHLERQANVEVGSRSK